MSNNRGQFGSMLTSDALYEISADTFIDWPHSRHLDQSQQPICFPSEVAQNIGPLHALTSTGIGELREASLKTPHSKCGVGVTPPWVRIPPSPPFYLLKRDRTEHR